MSAGSAMIIGGTGLLGRGIAGELLSAGWTVTLVSRRQVPVPQELSSLPLLAADRDIAGALASAIGDKTFDLVVDCAAYTAADASDAGQTFEGRVGHYFFIGTDFVYAPDPAGRFPVDEDADKLSGLSYADGKLDAEKFLLDRFHATGFPVTVLRPPHILGAGKALGCDPVAGGRDAQLPARLRAGDTIPLLADGLFLIQPVWSREVGRAVHALAKRKELYGTVLNVAGAECVTVRHYYEILAELLGVKVGFSGVDAGQFCRETPGKAHQARHRIYNLERLHKAGYAPQMKLEEAIQETLNWMMKA